MKQFLRLTSLFVLLLIFKQGRAQDAVHIAIIPFKAAANSNAATFIDQVQAVVTSAFANKNRFLILDRAQTEQLKKELDAAKDNASMYARVVAEQGHLAGAEYIITGIVSPVVIGQGTASIYNSAGKQQTIDQYHGSLNLFLQINRVETGQVVFSQPLKVASHDFDKRLDADIVDNVMCHLGTAIQAQLRELFPMSMTIISVDKTKKNGLPDKVLVSGGKEMFDTGKEADCPGDKVAPGSSSSTYQAFATGIGSLFSGKKKLLLDVISQEVLQAGGKSYNREKTIGQLKVESVEGELAVCTVTEGEKDIKEFMDAKKPLIIRVKKEEVKQ